MFKAIGKYVRAVGYLLTFQIDKASETLRSNPGVISANYDRIIQEKRARINQYKDAIAGMVTQEESKKAKLKAVVEEIEKLEKLKAGAAGKARQVAQKHGGNVEAVHADPEYQKCQAAFKDFSATLAEKQQRAAELEQDLAQLVENVARHKTQIMSQLRELEKLGEEKHDAVADVMSAQEEKQIADLMSDLSEDKTGEELRELRELRNKASAEARVSREIAGMDAKQAENDFLQYATDSAAMDEFDQLIGLAQQDEPAVSAPQERSQIPES